MGLAQTIYEAVTPVKLHDSLPFNENGKLLTKDFLLHKLQSICKASGYNTRP